jgi:hypothetical protein
MNPCCFHRWLLEVSPFYDSLSDHENSQHRTSSLMAFESFQGRRALLLDLIESRRRGEANSQVPGALSSYLSSIRPDKAFPIASQRHCIIPRFSCGQTKATRRSVACRSK